MDWRTRLRNLVNREDYLRARRMALIRIIDPIEGYVCKTKQEDAYLPRQRRGQHAERSTKYGPLQEPSSGRALTTAGRIAACNGEHSASGARACGLRRAPRVVPEE